MLLINRDTAAMIRPRLDPGEQIIWSDRPQQGLRLRKQDVFLIPFSLFWCGFAIFWEVGAMQPGAPDFFPIFGIPFVIMGLYLVAGRFVHDAWRRRHVAYALTDRRLLILSGAKERSVALASLDDIRLEEHGGTRGTIATGPEQSFWANGNIGSWTGAPSSPTLEGIENARQVYTLIRQRAAAAADRR
jgi:hypothetical protein